MTICIGMTASDGLVIAADSQESDQYFKRAQNKILPFFGAIREEPDPCRLACAFTGAGESGYIDSLVADIIKAIPPKECSLPDLEKLFTERIEDFHTHHIFPLASSPDPPGVDLLIGAYASWSTKLFVSCASTLRKAFPYAAVGAGAHFAMGVMSEFGSILDVRRTELLAAYVIGITKESVEHCGKYTVIFSLHNSVDVSSDTGSVLKHPSPIITHVAGRKIKRWEDAFGERWSARQTELLKDLIEEELTQDD